jgi:carbamate kinase
LDIIGAMTQGQIGYMVQNALQAQFASRGIKKQVVCVINQVLIDENDPEFVGENASKPVGNFMNSEGFFY